MARISQDELIGRLVDSYRTIFLLGGIDSGKTAFGLNLAEAARRKGIPVGYVDADIDQSTVGPPTCVGLKLCAGLPRVDAQTVSEADELAFVGAYAPEANLVDLVAGTARLVSHAREAGCQLVIVDTCSLISGVQAQVLKFSKADLIRPDHVVAFQRGEELDPILGVLSRFFSVEVTALKVDGEVPERSVEERLAARQKALASYFTPPLNRWRVKRTVFMPTLAPDADARRLDGLLVGLEDGRGRCHGIGLLEYQQEPEVLRMVSSVGTGARGLRLGSVRLTIEGKTIGRFIAQEIFS
ncbi:MAG TPA: Clp1/GlmU family protein [Actinomycetota bacterium]|nr:Clp1/GlmU family protein [Actinomycetota bacterium]